MLGRESGDAMTRFTGELTSRVVGLIGQLGNLPIFCPELILPIVAILINTNDWDVKKLDHAR